MKYVKIEDKYNVEIAPRNKGAISNYNTNTHLMLKDGYLPLMETEAPGDGFRAIYELKDGAIHQSWEKIEISLEELKEIKIEEINRIYTQKVSLAKIGTPDDEISTWEIQRIEAEAWEKDNVAATPFIDGIAIGRKMDRVELINKILAKTKAYTEYVSVLTGQRQFYEDRIKAAQTVEEAEAVVWQE